MVGRRELREVRRRGLLPANLRCLFIGHEQDVQELQIDLVPHVDVARAHAVGCILGQVKGKQGVHLSVFLGFLSGSRVPGFTLSYR